MSSVSDPTDFYHVEFMNVEDLLELKKVLQARLRAIEQEIKKRGEKE